MLPRHAALAPLLAAAALAACTPPPPAAPTVQVAVPAPEPEPNAAPPGYRCDGTPFHEASHDYCVYANALTWSEAKRACVDTGGQLASFGSDAKARALFAALGPQIGAGEGLWLGLSRVQKGGWLWVDSTIVRYSGWHKGEPNDDGGQEDCAEWKLGAGTWNDAPCFRPRGYICEQVGTAALSCDGKPVHTATSEYCFHLEPEDYWEEAKQACVAAGGALAVIKSAEENRQLYEAAGPRVKLDSLWVGLSDSAREGSWRWLSGERTGHPAWKDGEPNDFQGSEDCAEWFSESGKLNDLSCAERRPYVCEPAAAPPG